MLYSRHLSLLCYQRSGMEYRLHVPARLGFSASLSSSPKPGTTGRNPPPPGSPTVVVELVKQISAKALAPRHQVSVFCTSFPSTYAHMFRTLCFPKALIRRSVVTRAKMPSLQNLPDELLLNVINKLSVYDAMALSQQSRGIHAL